MTTEVFAVGGPELSRLTPQPLPDPRLANQGVSGTTTEQERTLLIGLRAFRAGSAGDGMGGRPHAHIAGDGPGAAYWWKATATHQGPIDPPGIPATGKQLEFDGVDIHEYRDGKIAELRIIVNMNDIAIQLGMVPDPGSTAEKIMVGMHKLRSRLTRS